MGVSVGRAVTETRPDAIVLTLNSGSSSLKFGLYRVSSAATDMLLAGEAGSIGDKDSQFHTQSQLSTEPSVT